MEKGSDFIIIRFTKLETPYTRAIIFFQNRQQYIGTNTSWYHYTHLGGCLCFEMLSRNGANVFWFKKKICICEDLHIASGFNKAARIESLERIVTKFSLQSTLTAKQLTTSWYRMISSNKAGIQ